jgi:hypothetical protein
MASLVLVALAHVLVFSYSYTEFIHPTFEYANYLYFSPTVTQFSVCTFFSVAPIATYRPSHAPANLGASLIYGVGYIPAQLMMLFMWQHDPFELYLVQLFLACSMAAIFMVGGKAWVEGTSLPEHLTMPMTALTAGTIAVTAFVYRNHLRFVSFEDVYDLRFETNELIQNPLLLYLTSWLPYMLLPFHMARWLMRRQAADLVMALAASLIVYASSGSKASLLTPLIMLGISSILKSGRDVLKQLLVRLVGLQGFVAIVIPNEDIFIWVKSILFMRILGTSGWTASVYYDYFMEHGYTYFTHIGPIRAVTNAYPYGELSLGQLIGVEYSGSPDANFNANFWASDGFAAFGLVGIPIVTLALCGVLYALNRSASRFSGRFVSLWLSGFWLALLNHPLTTALLSAGGGLIILGLWLGSANGRSSRANPRPPAPSNNPRIGASNENRAS